ncbi:MAG: sulfotransferase [Caulobacterales bacterium]
MSDPKDELTDHRQGWTPPPRPEWVQRINEEGYCMNISGVVPLDEASLLESAMRATGLSDFGADDWREPFQVLVKSFEEDAALNLMGRIRTRSELLQLLEARLQIEDWYKRHPEIDDQEIREPIFVVGQGRSGTSFLINFLASNPDNGALMQWEATFPAPPPEKETYLTDPRIEKAHKLIDQWNRVTPSIVSMHEFSGYVPMEDCQILGLNFMAPSWFGSLGQAAAYDSYMAKQSPMPALRYHRRVLKLLQWKNPRKHWTLKDPIHLDRLPELLTVYPDARFVWPHRDPLRALASTVSLIGTIQWGRSDQPFKGGSFEYVTDPVLSARRLDVVIDQLEAGVVPENRIYHMLYKDLVSDPMAAIDAMYRHLDLELSESGRAAMAEYLASNPRDARPAHKLSSGPDAAVKRARQAYSRYQEYFKIPSEVF